MRSSFVFFGFCMAAVLTACQTTEPGGDAPDVTAVPAGAEYEGARLAEALCSGCHATGPSGISPRPDAPTFASIANSAGLTETTLASYLRDSHNFPEQMNIELAQEDAEALASYMITLRSPDFKPETQ